MSYDFDKRLLFFEIEGSEGTEETIVAADAVVTRNLQPATFDADVRTRETDGQFFGSRREAEATRRVSTTFEVEVAGSGTNNVAPPWMKFLRIGGMDAGVSGASNVVQSPISDNIPSATLHPFVDNLRVPMLGTRADWSMTFEDDQLPFFNLNVQGFPKATPGEQQTPLVPDVSAFQEPVYANNDNTTFTLDGFAAELRRLTINGGSILTPRSFIGSADRVKYRNRAMTGEAVIKAPLIGSKDYLSLMNSVVPLQLIHGTVAGNIVQIDCARAEIGRIAQSDEEGDLMFTIPLRFIPSDATGNDELIITTS